MDKNDILSVFEDPNRIWNLDESSFDLCPSYQITQRLPDVSNILRLYIWTFH